MVTNKDQFPQWNRKQQGIHNPKWWSNDHWRPSISRTEDLRIWVARMRDYYWHLLAKHESWNRPEADKLISSIIWLVVSTPLNNISQWEGLSHILWNIQNIPNHQSDLISLYTWVNADSYEQLPSHRLSRCCLLWYPRFTYPMLMGFGWNLNCPNFPGRCFFVANLGCFSKDQDSYVLPASKLT